MPHNAQEEEPKIAVQHELQAFSELQDSMSSAFCKNEREYRALSVPPHHCDLVTILQTTIAAYSISMTMYTVRTHHKYVTCVNPMLNC